MDPAREPAKGVRWPRIRARVAARLGLGLVGTSMLLSLTLTAALPRGTEYVYVMFFAGGLCTWAALPVIQLAVLNAPSPRRHPLRFGALHLVAYVLFASLTVCTARVVIVGLFALLGLDHTLRALWSELLFEVQNSSATYAGIALVWTAHEASERKHAASLRTLQLSASVAAAQLDALRARVSPAALKAALDDVRAVMQRDVEEAEARIEALGNELRAKLSQPVELGAAATSAVPMAEDELRPWSWTWPRIRPVHAALALAACLGLSLTTGGALQAALGPADGRAHVLALLRGFGLFAALPIPCLAVVNWPELRGNWLRYAAAHGLASQLFSVVWSALEHGLSRLAAGWLPLDPSLATFRSTLLFEYQRTALFYWAAVGVVSYAWFGGRRRLAEQRATGLQEKLVAAQLDALVARLEPHFLYNALNTISASMHADVGYANQLLFDLEGLLDAACSAEAPTWTLAEERTLAQRYVAFVEARFGDRIRVDWRLPPALDPVQLPRFTIQLLIENAIKHNQLERGELTITVLVRRVPEGLQLCVTDTGRGFARSRQHAEGSLARLEQTLSLLHGPAAARLFCSNTDGGGARVELHIPWSS